MTNEYEVRRSAVADGLAERKLDALLVAAGPNLRYLTGFTGDNGSLLLLEGRAILFTDPRFEIQAAQETTCRIKIGKGPLVVDVISAIRRLGVSSIGYEPARLTCEAFDALRSRLPMKAALKPAAGWIEQLRMVKSASEIELIRRSVLTNSGAFEQAAARVRLGMKEQRPGCRAGIPHAPAGSREAQLRDHCRGRGSLRIAARAAHRRHGSKAASSWWWIWARCRRATPAT